MGSYLKSERVRISDIYCTTLGYLENLKNKEFNNISVIDQEKVKEDFSRDVPLPKPMSDSVKVDFLAQANIKVPVQERKAYKELIAQHHCRKVT